MKKMLAILMALLMAALLLNVSLSALLRANPCLAPSDFKQGACINIPED